MKTPLLISVVGQTATGKTSLTLKLAQELLEDRKKVVLLSADSKQVFQGLEILTGADIPEGFQSAGSSKQFLPFFQHTDQLIELHGIACVAGDAEWSAAHFQKLFEQLYKNLSVQSAMIIVGGTGLYHQQVFNPAETVSVKPNTPLREKLETQSLAQLQQTLQSVWPERWKNMNHSDRSNPRRLIRAIEVTQTDRPVLSAASIWPAKQIGLRLSSQALEKKIAERVQERLDRGAVQEIVRFEKTYPQNTLQAKTSLGYQEILRHLTGELTAEELRQAWTLAEIQYAKRQATWWKKRADIQWFEAKRIDFSALKSYTFS